MKIDVLSSRELEYLKTKIQKLTNELKCVRGMHKELDLRYQNFLAAHSREHKALQSQYKYNKNRLDAHFEAHADNELQELIRDKETFTLDFVVNDRGTRTGHTWSDIEERWLQRWLQHEFRTRVIARLKNNVNNGMKQISTNVSEVINELAVESGRTSHAIRCRLEQLNYDIDFM